MTTPQPMCLCGHLESLHVPGGGSCTAASGGCDCRSYLPPGGGWADTAAARSWASVKSRADHGRRYIDGLSAALDVARDEVQRLRAGEDGTPPEEGVEPTPAQWIARWNRLTADERQEWARRVLDNAATASDCFIRNHEGRIRHDDAAISSLRVARDEARAAARRFSDVVTAYMLGDVDGAAVSRAQTDLTAAIAGPEPAPAAEFPADPAVQGATKLATNSAPDATSAGGAT